MKTPLGIFAVLLAALPIRADVVDEARLLMEKGDYASARELLEPARRKGVAEASLLLGRMAFKDYDFERAGTLYAQYRKLRKEQPSSPDLDPEAFESQLAAAREYLGRVEDVAILDSVGVDASQPWKVIPLPESAGQLLAPSAIPSEEGRRHGRMAFMTENRQTIIWSQPDDKGKRHLMESFLLTDGTWSHPSVLELPEWEGDAEFPFLLADGTTLYFAGRSDTSAGGRDIYVATRDAVTREFMQPQNLGFPYNSPSDDYMMAIDEEQGIGWWATTRDNEPGRATVYTFAVNDVRRNLDPDADDIIERARITSVKATQTPGRMLPPLMNNRRTDAAARVVEFNLPMPNGKEYTAYSDFRNPQAAKLMRQYRELQTAYAADCAKLSEVRRQYAASPDEKTARQAQRLEQSVAGSRRHLASLLSELYRLELGR